MPAKKKTDNKLFINSKPLSIKSEIVESAPPIKEEELPSQMSEVTPVNLEKTPEETPAVHSDIISEIIAEHEEQKDPNEIVPVPIIETENTTVNIPVEEKKRPKNFIMLFLVFVIGTFIGAGLIFVYLTRFSKTKSNVPNEQDSSAEVSVSPIPTQETTKAPVDLKKYSIEVLNGSGTSGLAGNLKTTLETEGFNVLSSGNATNSSFIETVIRSKTNVDQSFVEKLKSILDKSFVVTETPDLLDTEKSDVVIIIGSKTPQTFE